MRKGQISLFIILAIVLLIIVVTFLLVQRSASPLTNPQSELFTTDDFSPTQLFIRQCVQESLREGLNRAGVQGGYITLPADVQLPTKHLAPSPNFPLKTPLWVDNGDVYMPTTAQVESELASWITQDVVSCLETIDAASFEDVSSFGSPQSAVTIVKEGIIVDLNYTLISSNAQKSEKQQQFTTAFPVHLWDALETGRTILEAHSEDPFLADTTINLMSLDGERVPLADFSLRCGEQKWQTRQVKQSVQELLYYNIPRIRVQNTNHRPFNEPLINYVPFADIGFDNYEERAEANTLPENRPSDLFDFQHYYWDIGLSDQMPVTASFRYLDNYPMQLAVSPSENGILSSRFGQPSTDFLSFFCVQTYKFTYDVVYLVEVAITDPNAWADGDDFTLRFALPVHLDNNIPKTTPVNFQTVTDQATRTEFCNNRFDETVNIYVQDRATNQDAIGAEVFYECGGVSCALGTVESQGSGGVVRLQTNIPQGCFGGVFRAEADNIETVKKQWNNFDEQIQLQTDFTMPIALRVVTNTVGTAEDGLRDDQSAYVSIVASDGSFESSIVLEGAGTVAAKLLEKETLYNVTVSIFDNNFLSGGYTGQFAADRTRRQNTLVLHALHDTSYPQESDDIYEFYLDLEDPETYEDLYYPVWN